MDKGKPADAPEPTATTLVVPIPCRETECATTCDHLPPVLDDEVVWVPDIARNLAEWNARGRAVTETLSHKASPCSESGSPKKDM